MGSVVVRAFACALAGTLAWIICEPFFPRVFSGFGAMQVDARWAAVEQILFLLLGALVGGTSGVLHGAARGGRRNILVSGALGLVFGAVGGGLGKIIGGAVFAAVVMGTGGPGPIARVAAFVPMALAIGAAVGASQMSVRSLFSGAIGGAIAGFITGMVFDPLAAALASVTMLGNMGSVAAGQQVETGAPGRAAMAFGLGLFIGLFTALVDRVTRRAWLRLVVGRNEGREWPIDAGQTLIGRDERAHVPLFGDAQIPALAAVIQRQGQTYMLVDPNSPIGVGHNGIRVPQALLRHGDTIQVGSLNLQFLMRAGSAQAAAEGRAKAHAISHGQFAAGPAPAQPAPWSAPQQQPHQASPSPTAHMPQPGVATVAPAAFSLVAVSGPLTGQRVPVAGSLEIGREAAGLALGFDSQASRRHATVTPTQAGLIVTDLGSTNGTFVNGQRVTSAQARPGDTILIGSTQFRVE
ncbi:MAG: FHA domain-containing protein [Fimbriimonadaceae bacterium]|nr:FHA domain-containing protein [Fimbriimonadaceae bacterium]QYK56916.1 MAG: FHA domain-containing protein [Fimbriimonadaceae bacterium]